jgi:hypothetical protein
MQIHRHLCTTAAAVTILLGTSRLLVRASSSRAGVNDLGGSRTICDPLVDNHEGGDIGQCSDRKTGTSTLLLQHGTLDSGVTTSEASVDTVTSPAPLNEDALGSDLGVPQVIDMNNQQQALDVIQKGRDYLQQIVMKNDTYAKVRTLCRNQNSQCAFWSSEGECEANPGRFFCVVAINCVVPTPSSRFFLVSFLGYLTSAFGFVVFVPCFVCLHM